VPTPAVYAAWDSLGGPAHRSGNDLTNAAIAVEPALGEWRDRIAAAAGVDPVLAGSGATWFLPGHHEALAGSLAGAEVILTHTTPQHPLR
jgi:4-diphosphocytidyl-2-C-methyl-D-erythritol kinase